jgi:hypothetical protein
MPDNWKFTTVVVPKAEREHSHCPQTQLQLKQALFPSAKMASNVLAHSVFAESEVFTMVIMKRTVFWVVTRDSLTFLRNISLASSGLKSK